jgi:hypothetical protein
MVFFHSLNGLEPDALVKLCWSGCFGHCKTERNNKIAKYEIADIPKAYPGIHRPARGASNARIEG